MKWRNEMSSKLKIACAWTAVMIVIVSCALSGGDLSEEEKLKTAVALALEAVEVEEDDGDEAQIPTITTSPTDTPEGPPTDTPEPCNRAKFISETVEDGADFSPNENFTKTWRIRNDGTCTWNTNYKLVFVDGDHMSGPASKNLTQSVSPGEQV
ncbi:MAG: NBR1-Ig-like domain-containing protein, partial [Desulfobacterales bacterium]|nr:NBR1-Ig-like domain-containing protein [Desulfobacterales bacterium]